MIKILNKYAMYWNVGAYVNTVAPLVMYISLFCLLFFNWKSGCELEMSDIYIINILLSDQLDGCKRPLAAIAEPIVEAPRRRDRQRCQVCCARR